MGLLSRLHTSAHSHQGLVRSNNEDSVLVLPLPDIDACLLLVCDGVGGKNSGEIASQTAIAVFAELAAQQKFALLSDDSMRSLLLNMAVLRAHKAIADLAQREPQHQGMATTLSLALVQNERLTLAQVGDSRVYLFRHGKLTQLSRDQTLADDLLASGRIAPADYATHPDRNVLSQALGVEAVGQPLEPVISEFPLSDEDLLLLCTDGLTDMVTDAGISHVLQTQLNGLSAMHIATQGVALDELGTQLIEAALAAGGRDNVSLVLAHIKAGKS